MRTARTIHLPLVLVVLGFGWAAPRQDESPAVHALKEKGLVRTGTTFTIEDEKPVLASMKEARSAFTAYTAISDQQDHQQQIALRAAQVEEQKAELQAELDDLNQRIGDVGASSFGPSGGGGPGGGGPGGGGPGGMQGRAPASPLTIRRDQLKQMLPQVAAEQRLLKSQAPQAKDVAALEGRARTADERFKNSLADLRKLVDEVRQKYAELAADAGVEAALADAKKANPRIHLGPSDGFNSATKELEKAEQRFLGKRATAVSKKRSRTKR